MGMDISTSKKEKKRIVPTAEIPGWPDPIQRCSIANAALSGRARPGPLVGQRGARFAAQFVIALSRLKERALRTLAWKRNLSGAAVVRRATSAAKADANI